MEKRQHRQKEVLMTEGPIWRCLLLFALPLMAGNLFQQLYNTVDSIVVGNFVGKEALAAVGSTDSVINTFIGFFSGMSTGAGVIISQYYGGKKEEKVSIAVQTHEHSMHGARPFACSIPAAPHGHSGGCLS